MEVFDAANLCPECDGAAASYEFHAHACPAIGAEPEHMHRQCPMCGHEWGEAPRVPTHHDDVVRVDRDEA